MYLLLKTTKVTKFEREGAIKGLRSKDIFKEQFFMAVLNSVMNEPTVMIKRPF